jgi:hypothetical protein
MTWDGMYPQHNCKQCGQVLNPDGHRPAELYAGTYTGICYACERSGPYVVEAHIDGAMLFSYPPHCPAWRRDRETYYTYLDCNECGGTGRHYVSRSAAYGGPYSRYCESCMQRFFEYPKRVKARRRLTCFWETANALCVQEARNLGLDQESSQYQELVQQYLAKYRALVDKVIQFSDTRVKEK